MMDNAREIKSFFDFEIDRMEMYDERIIELKEIID